MSELKIFENDSFGSVRIVMINDDPWFVAADVCKCLGLSNPSQILTYLDDDEKQLLTTVIAPNAELPDLSSLATSPRGFYVISESGLYQLVLRSRKLEAPDFRRWVTHKILPFVRKAGSYTEIEKAAQPKSYSLADQILARKTILEICYEGNQLALALDKTLVKLTGCSALQEAEVQLITSQS